jgi:hypothetical protein
VSRPVPNGDEILSRHRKAISLSAVFKWSTLLVGGGPSASAGQVRMDQCLSPRCGWSLAYCNRPEASIASNLTVKQRLLGVELSNPNEE